MTFLNVFVGGRVSVDFILKRGKLIECIALCLFLPNVVDSTTDHHIHWFLLVPVPLLEHHGEVPDPGSHHCFHLEVDSREEPIHLPEVDESAACKQDFAAVGSLDRVIHATDKAVKGVYSVFD